MAEDRLRIHSYNKINRKIVVGILVLVILGSFGYLLNRMMDKIDQLKIENSKLKEENNFLESKDIVLVEENKRLGDDLDALINKEYRVAINETVWPIPKEEMSPQDFIDEDKIVVLKNRVTFYVDDSFLTGFADTNSMDPVLDKEANGIQIKPKKEDEIKVGDIVSYNVGDKIVIHRVIKTGNDEDGWYAILRGDNEELYNLNKIRFSQIHGILVAIIY